MKREKYLLTLPIISSMTIKNISILACRIFNFCIKIGFEFKLAFTTRGKHQNHLGAFFKLCSSLRLAHVYICKAS